MKLYITAFIGIAINIWRDTYGTGGGPFGPAIPPAAQLLDRFGVNIKDRAGNNLESR